MMNYKRLITTSAVIFIFAILWNSSIHGVILREANAALTGITRSTIDRPMGLALLLTAGLAFLFVWSYTYVARQGTWQEGLKHGLFFALLAGLLVNLNQYVLYPIPPLLTLKWFFFGVVEFCAYGILASWLYPIRTKNHHPSQ
ncbi:hypothetical protein [Altericista sp. CCNU0014]|uniref:hypothetical protein n=1 Tax=Altericista sp. CCNU0014 TaxID=3082949 RepID=UPI00384AEB6F